MYGNLKGACLSQERSKIHCYNGVLKNVYWYIVFPIYMIYTCIHIINVYKLHVNTMIADIIN